MARLISFPFRLDTTGGVATLDQGSDTEIDEQIAVAALTRPGERIQAPTFGIADPAFVGFEVGALQRHCDDFGPDVDIRSIDVRHPLDGREEVAIEWERREEIREVPA